MYTWNRCGIVPIHQLIHWLPWALRYTPPKAAGHSGQTDCASPKRRGSGRTGCVRQSGGAQGERVVWRQSGGDIRDPPPTRTHPSISTRRRRHLGAPLSRGGGNPSPSSFDTLSSSALHPPAPVARATRSPRVAPMPRPRVSRRARAAYEPTPATPGPSSFPRRRESIPPGPIARTTRSPRVAPMLQRRVSRGARRGLRADASDARAFVFPAEAGIHPRRRSTRSPRVHFIPPGPVARTQSVHPE